MGFIYSLQCECHDDGPRYVGLTHSDIRRRLSSHLSEAKSGTMPRHKWIRKHGFNITISALESVPDGSDLPGREIAWIAALREGGALLLNCTTGGEGTSGYTHSEEGRRAMSLAKMGTRTGPRPEHVKAKLSVSGRKRFDRNDGDSPMDSKAKFTYDEADAIRRRHASGESQRAISRDIGLSRKSLSRLISGETYVRPAASVAGQG